MSFWVRGMVLIVIGLWVSMAKAQPLEEALIAECIVLQSSTHAQE
ncbi:hypothetical protein [uncultured Shimia sp.]|nr:hypothetical protein [uncultured Shimia sp.]